jgi:hypothetical protein
MSNGNAYKTVRFLLMTTDPVHMLARVARAWVEWTTASCGNRVPACPRFQAPA